MRRSILLVLVAALALASGISTSASAAAVGGSQAAAKKKCNAKPKKGKRKGRSSLAAGAAATGKKKKTCKAKRKAKPKAGRSLVDGTYQDAGKGVTVVVTGRGKKAEVRFTPPSSACTFGVILNGSGPLVASGSASKANGTIEGGFFAVGWALAVQTPALSYQLQLDTKLGLPDQPPCQATAELKGKLTKKG